MTGSCLCGGVTVTLKQDLFSKPNGHICYCDSCRKMTGTSGLNSLATTRNKIEIHDTKSLISAVLFTIPHWEGGCSVPLGIFSKIPQPEYEFYPARKMEWLRSLDGV